mmetsp:Transcript_50077/g.123016  ORF Transcript_50077/g.123016 Transcript_50077/m.123016 type:complete len:306 (+) Transcript_50077:1974-2891(+)
MPSTSSANAVQPLPSKPITSVEHFNGGQRGSRQPSLLVQLNAQLPLPGLVSTKHAGHGGGGGVGSGAGVGAMVGGGVVGELVGDGVGDDDGVRDGDNVGDDVGRRDGDCVGVLVGAGVGAALGERDGAAVGVAVGSADGAGVGVIVGAAVGVVVGERVGAAVGVTDGGGKVGTGAAVGTGKGRTALCRAHTSECRQAVLQHSSAASLPTAAMSHPSIPSHKFAHAEHQRSVPKSGDVDGHWYLLQMSMAGTVGVSGLGSAIMPRGSRHVQSSGTVHCQMLNGSAPLRQSKKKAPGTPSLVLPPIP